MKTLLILEDCPDLRQELVEHIKENTGTQTIFQAATTREALKLIEKEPIDLIVTDHNLGPRELTGLDMITHLRKYHYTVPIILFTANLSVKENGKFILINKPDIKGLIDKVNDLIGD